MRLTRREKRLALGLAFFLGVWGLYALWIKPASARLQTLQRIMPEKAVVLDQLRLKSRQLITLRDRLSRIHQRLADQPDDFDLLSFLESLTEQCGLSAHVQAMTPDIYSLDQTYSELLITLELREITLPQLVDFLKQVPSAKIPVRVKNLNIKNNPAAPGRLDAVIGVSNLKLDPKAQ